MRTEGSQLTTHSLTEAIQELTAETDFDGTAVALVRACERLTGASLAALRLSGNNGAARYVTTNPEARAWARSGDPPRGEHLMTAAVRTQGADLGVLYLARSGADFASESQGLVRVLVQTGGLALGRARADAANERRRRWLEAATDLTHTLTQELPFTWALEQIARRARAASDARAAAMVLLPRSRPATVAVYDGPTGLVTERSLIEAVVAALAAEPPVTEPHVVVVPVEPTAMDASALALVLPPGADAWQERGHLADYARQAALALDMAQAQRDRVELAVLAERGHIVRDLQETIVQRLFAAGLHLEAVREAPPEAVEKSVVVAIDALDAVIRDIRDTVLDPPPTPSTEGPQPASSSLAAMTAAWVRRSTPSLASTVET